MGNAIFTADSIGLNVRGDLSSAGDGAYVAAGVTVGSTDNYAIAGTQTGHTAIIAGRAIGAFGISLGNSYNVDSYNAVEVRAGAEVIGFNAVGIMIQASVSTVKNAGYIFGRERGLAIFGDGLLTSSVTNTGRIEGDTNYGVERGGSETFLLTNSGTIKGANYSFTVSFGNGNNQVVNSGTMIGQIGFGSGNDLYDGRLGHVQGMISGAFGTDRIYGGTEANVIDGGASADYLAGGKGNDTYIINRTVDGLVTDTIVEALNAGIDTVNFTASLPNQAYILGANVERLMILGTLATNGTGNTLANTIVGNTGANVISGSAGLDTLTGGLGSDRFVFNTAPSAANLDRITDFNVAADTIVLENAIFTKVLGAVGASIGAAQFWKSTTGLAHDANDRIIYETDTGKVFYDSNGNAAGGAVQIAIISPNLVLTHLDFVIM